MPQKLYRIITLFSVGLAGCAALANSGLLSNLETQSSPLPSQSGPHPLMSPSPSSKPSPTPSPTPSVLRVQMVVNGTISQNPDVRYIFVMNETGSADTLQEGPKLFGPWLQAAPKVGWDLPFYIGSNSPDGSIEASLLSAQSPPVLIEPNTWTDAFILFDVAGTEQVSHIVRTNSATGDMQTIAPANPPTLTQGVDWLLTSSQGPSGPQDTWQLNLPLKVANDYDLTALSSKTVNANFVIQQIPPANADVSQYSYTGPNGWIIDQWNAAPDDFVHLPLSPSFDTVFQSSSHLGAPVFPQNAPPGVASDDVTLKEYTTQAR